MLLLHQSGTVHVGEVVRYTLTYTPSADRILPPPRQLHVKIKNTSAIPLRAAYLRGPYTLYVACYPTTFDPNTKFDAHEEEGAPSFEPNLKAGGHWHSKLTVPEHVRSTVEATYPRHGVDRKRRSFSWIIEVASQVIFSTTAAVHFEVLVGRDERSIELGQYPTSGAAHGHPGKLQDAIRRRADSSLQYDGVYSKAVTLAVDDTQSLWNTPAFPQWQDDKGKQRAQGGRVDQQQDQHKPPSPRRRQKVHLVIVTHGIHSNTGADMLYLKESIDATAKQAREDARLRKAEMKAKQLERDKLKGGHPAAMSTPDVSLTKSLTPEDEVEEDDDDEQVIVRGFQDNVVRTERGIQYLGKRLAKYVLSITYPDQAYLPMKSSISKSIAKSLANSKSPNGNLQPAHKKSTIVKDESSDGSSEDKKQAYRISSISFVGHSLGGLTQTYAVAYIKKHSPEFFDKIKPINFVAMASPFLGLSNENPIYVKFALDFGLVGRTGQDLGLTWTTPTVVRSGWSAMIGGLGNENRRGSKSEGDPGSKPLLRILPSGPAHAALKLFRNRSVYSNVVNDGIVPLRTSCLLFLDWRGLDRVEKARRENGLVGTMVGWGWAEMMGQNASSVKHGLPWMDFFSESGEEGDAKKKGSKSDHDKVPQPSEDVMNEDHVSAHNIAIDPQPHQFIGEPPRGQSNSQDHSATQQSSTAWSGLLSLFKPQAAQKPTHRSPKHTKIYSRSQTTRLSGDSEGSSSDIGQTSTPSMEQRVRGPSFYSDVAHNDELEAPPKTTFFESAGDVLKPPLPSKEYLIDPTARPRTIFHDRVYHPEDIPPPMPKESRSLIRRSRSKEFVPKHTPTSSASSIAKNKTLTPPSTTHESIDMKIEEKIARAYHRDLSWRKVLVRLEPDAHNNMVVRRMFANAYGWPVIKHMCDTHFAFTSSAQTDDAEEANVERAQGMQEQIDRAGEQVQGQQDPPDLEIDDRGRDKEQAEAQARTLSESDLPKNPTSLSSPLSPPVLDDLRSPPKRTDSEIREASDQVPDMTQPSTSSTTTGTANSSSHSSHSHSHSHSHGAAHSSANASNASSSTHTLPRPTSRLSRQDSARWSDRFFDVTDDDDDDDNDSDDSAEVEPSVNSLSSATRSLTISRDPSSPKGTSDAEIAPFLAASPPKAKPKAKPGLGLETGVDVQPKEMKPRPLVVDEFTATPRALRGGDRGRDTGLSDER